MSILRTRPRRRAPEPQELPPDRPAVEREPAELPRERPAVEGEPAARERTFAETSGAPAAREQAPRRRRFWRAREAGAAAAATVGWGVLVIARLVMTVASLIALLIVLAIVLRDVDANAGNTIVKGIHDGANFFAGAFTGLITFNGHPKRELTVDWGIAALVYLVAGAVIARWIARIGRSGLRFDRRRRPAV
jgi:hypothetical protein